MKFCFWKGRGLTKIWWIEKVFRDKILILESFKHIERKKRDLMVFLFM